MPLIEASIIVKYFIPACAGLFKKLLLYVKLKCLWCNFLLFNLSPSSTPVFSKITMNYLHKDLNFEVGGYYLL